MKPGLPPKSAAPNELRKLGVSPRFCNWPSSASRLKYIPKPARMENLCAPASPMSPCGPPLGDHAKPKRGPKWLYFAVAPPAVLQPGSPGNRSPGNPPGNTLEVGPPTWKQVMPSPLNCSFLLGVSASQATP